mgnify:CR=1 FL=1
MKVLSKAEIKLHDYELDQDSYIAINQEGVVVGLCPESANVVSWMRRYTAHRFLITSTAEAINMTGKPLNASDKEIFLR